ncbi:hypothetical protein EGW08_011170, partial [Elysia chlorotica]
RKRILDFYHRNSMVAYCTAFAYKPLPRGILDWPEHVYTELVESPSATKVAHGEDVGQRSHSVDSLLELSPASSVEELRVGHMLQSHQTFLGMISLQYQARQDFVQLISKLESACIKFVHFSKENEVRSRVFAEKMGLEAGWNCHVSLMAVSSEPVSSANSSKEDGGRVSRSSGEEDSGDEEEEELDVHSDSRCTSSYVTENTEDSLTGVFDNRAHLPRGIENVRPHLKNVDNVPLLVNLFTDCVPEATQEMIKIMQENGEVVLVVGSSLNMENTSIFLQGDCSIAIEPMYPQLCVRRPVLVQPWAKEDLQPTQLASRALALPCPLFFQRHDNIKLIELIMESRHFILALRNSFYLMLCCSLMLVLSQLLCCLMLLPPPLAVQHELWMVSVVVPALSLSLLGNPNEARTLSMATHKNINLVNKQMVLEFLIQFICRFVPSIFVTLISFALVLNSACARPDHECSLYSSRITGAGNSSDVTAWTIKFQGGLVLAQNIFHLYLAIFMVAVSMSLVHWQDHLWQKLPFKNLVWSITAASIIVLQVLFTVFDVWARHSMYGDQMPLSEVHPSVWVLGCVWPFVAIALNELSKRREIKLALRAQKRARLDFDTKLGMNSPF